MSGRLKSLLNYFDGRHPTDVVTTAVDLLIELLRAPDQEWVEVENSSGSYVLRLPNGRAVVHGRLNGKAFKWARVNKRFLWVWKVEVDGKELPWRQMCAVQSLRLDTAMAARRRNALEQPQLAQLSALTQAAQALEQRRTFAGAKR